jgi:hypothetical protein
VPGDLTNAVAIAAGDYHSLALRSDGTVTAWGGDFSGETHVPGGLSNVIAVAASGGHSLALKSDGTVVAWGRADFGGNTPPAGLSNVSAIEDALGRCLAIVAAPPQFLLANPHWQNGMFTVSVPTQVAKSYQLQYKIGLSESWKSLPPVTGSGSALTLTDTDASSTQRFYRVSER